MRRYICILLVIVFAFDNGIATKSVNIECDSISNYHRGRKYCIIKGVQTDQYTKISYEPSLFSTMKSELLFDKCKLYSIPIGIFSAFPKLKTMYTWNSGLVTIRKEDFRSAAELRELDVSMNLVTELVESTFFYAHGLEYLNLASNQIRILPKLTFHGLIWLKVLHLDGNDIEQVWPGTFDVTPRLEMLYLNNNRIRTIDRMLFVRNVGLIEIHMHCNNISRFDGMVAAHLKKLISFRANDNPIVGLQHIQVDSVYTNIRNIGCAGCVIGNRTEKLLASNNRIEYIVLDTTTPKITDLELNSNRLTSFRNITQLTQLNVLDISHNQINNIGIQSFAHLTQLSILKLRQSGLNSINFGLFSYKPRLRLLDISHNQLGRIELIMFTGLKNVRYLYLEGNNIVRMDMSSIRQYFPLLSTIGLAQNSWNCTNLALAVKLLEANRIELNSVGLTKNYTNIKGIPCDSRNWSSMDNLRATTEDSVEITTLESVLELEATSSKADQSNEVPLMASTTVTTENVIQSTTSIKSTLPNTEEPIKPPKHEVPKVTPDTKLMAKLRQMRREINSAAGQIVRISKTLYDLVEIASNNQHL